MKKKITFFLILIVSLIFWSLFMQNNVYATNNLNEITQMLWWWGWNSNNDTNSNTNNTNNVDNTTIVTNNWWNDNAVNQILNDWSNWSNWSNWWYVDYWKWKFKVENENLKNKISWRLKVLAPFWSYTAQLWLKSLFLIRSCIEEIWNKNIIVNWKIYHWTSVILNNTCKLTAPLPWFKKNRVMWIKWKELTEYISLNQKWINLWDLLFWNIKTNWDLVINFLSAVLWFIIFIIILFFPSKSDKEVEVEWMIDNTWSEFIDSWDQFWDQVNWWWWNEITEKLWKKLSKSSLLWMMYIVLSNRKKEEDNFIDKFILISSLLITILMIVWMWYTITQTIYSSIIISQIYINWWWDIFVISIWMFILLILQLIVIRFWIIKYYLSYLYDKILSWKWVDFKLLFYNLFGSIIAITVFYMIIKFIMSIIQIIVSLS